MALTIIVRKVDSVIVVEMSGRLLIGRPVEDFRETMRRLLDDGNRSFVLNLSGVSYMDSAGLGQTLAAFTSVKDHGGHVALLGPSARTEQLLQIVKLVTVFDTYDEEAEAIDSLKRIPVPVAARC